jgi:hypothetical protein
MEALLPMIIQLASGAIGGNVAGSVLKEQSLGTAGNSIVGILGGGLGGQILTMLLGAGAAGGGMSLVGIAGSIASGGVGGGVLLAIVGMIRSVMNK